MSGRKARPRVCAKTMTIWERAAGLEARVAVLELAMRLAAPTELAGARAMREVTKARGGR